MSSAVEPPPGTDAWRLERLARIASDVGAEALRAQIDAFRRRIGEGRFYVACVGEFKRGKSTLLNALVGRAVLPMGIVPVTTVPTILHYGDDGAHVRFTGGRSEAVPLTAIDGYVSEAHNPRNARGVEAVDIALPSPTLHDGLCLVDTPGVGSVYEENTAATRAFVPQIDAVLVVIGADPPISGDELRLIASAARHVEHVIVVLNKADRVSDAERDEAVRFAADLLATTLGRPTPILVVSAAERLEQRGPCRDWDRLLASLADLSAQSGQALVQSALRRGVDRFARLCLREIDERNAAFYRPVEESDERIEAIRKQAGRIAHESLLLGFAMEHEIERAMREREARRDAFVEQAIPDAQADVAAALRAGPLRARLSPRRRADALARRTAADRLAPWLSEHRRTGDDWYRALTDDFLARAHHLLDNSPELAALGVRELSAALDPVDAIRVAARGDPEARVHATRPVPWWRRALDVGAVLAGRPVAERAAAAIVRERMTDAAAAVDADLARRATESTRRLKDEVHHALDAAFQTADRAVARAREVRAAGADAFRTEARRLHDLRQEVAALAATPHGH